MDYKEGALGFNGIFKPASNYGVRASEPRCKQLAAIPFKRCIDPARMYPPGFAVYITLGVTDMSQSITLNLPHDLADAEWAKVMTVYESMDDWVPGQPVPCWFGPLDSSKYLAASVEPSGLLLEGNVAPLLFRGWVTKLCAKLTLALGREVYDAEV